MIQGCLAKASQKAAVPSKSLAELLKQLSNSEVSLRHVDIDTPTEAQSLSSGPIEASAELPQHLIQRKPLRRLLAGLEISAGGFAVWDEPGADVAARL